jgi:hypothetical protein
VNGGALCSPKVRKDNEKMNLVNDVKREGGKNMKKF